MRKIDLLCDSKDNILKILQLLDRASIPYLIRIDDSFRKEKRGIEISLLLSYLKLYYKKSDKELTGTAAMVLKVLQQVPEFPKLLWKKNIL